MVWYVRAVVLVCADDVSPTGMAEPDAVALARADGALHLVGVGGRGGEQRGAREGRGRGFGARDAEAAVSVAEGGLARGPDDAVLHRSQSYK